MFGKTIEEDFDNQLRLEQKSLNVRKQVAMAEFEKEQEMLNKFESIINSILKRHAVKEEED